MRKYFQISTVLGILGFLVFIRGQNASGGSLAPVGNGTTPSSNNTGSPASTQSGSATGTYKDGTYAGSVQDAYYGSVQVQAVIKNGKISNVVFLQYPNDNRTSQYINGQAMPLLIQEAIQAQSASVNGVSGASATSPAFQQSLADALSQAK